MPEAQSLQLRSACIARTRLKPMCKQHWPETETISVNLVGKSSFHSSSAISDLLTYRTTRANAKTTSLKCGAQPSPRFRRRTLLRREPTCGRESLFGNFRALRGALKHDPTARESHLKSALMVVGSALEC